MTHDIRVAQQKYCGGPITHRSEDWNLTLLIFIIFSIFSGDSWIASHDNFYQFIYLFFWWLLDSKSSASSATLFVVMEFWISLMDVC